jgi:hypothetical protein
VRRISVKRLNRSARRAALSGGRPRG